MKRARGQRGQRRREAHRPRGLASRCVLIFPKSDAAGYYIQIGLDLYDRLGAPARVRLETRPGGWALIPSPAGTEEGHAVQLRQGNVPRFSIGKERHEALGLGTGHYPALVLDGRVIF